MLDVCLLGTGGMLPMPKRYLTSMIARYNGQCVLVDCGEGSQMALKKAGLSPKPIDIMCFTHFHADHISGLPGMLLSMGNAEKTTPLTIIAPKGGTKIVNSLCIIAPELPFEVNVIEIAGNEQHFSLFGFEITAFKVSHNVPCYGYTIEIKRAGKFNLEAAKALPIPVSYWGRLQRGETVDYEGVTYTPDLVMGEERKGIKVTYSTDTRPTESIVSHAENSDLFICEGMYAEPGMEEKAKKYKHMTFYEAARMALAARVKELWLTHFSPSLVDPRPYLDTVRKIFPNTYLGKDGKYIEIDFEDEEDETRK